MTSDPWISEPADSQAYYLERFPRLDLAELLDPNRPEREWVVDSLIPLGASVSLVAPAGTGKSLAVLGMCIGVARGDATFAGLRLTRRRVLVLDMENTEDDLAERFTSFGVTVPDLEGLADLIYLHLPSIDPLDTPTGGSMLAGLLDAYGMRPGDVLVLDSFQRVTEGPENDSDTLRAYVRCTGTMLKRRGITVIRTDNTGKDAERGARGTSGKKDDVDVELLVVRDAEKGDLLHLKVGKVRLPGIEPIRLQLVEGDDGRLTYSSAEDPHRRRIKNAAADIARVVGSDVSVRTARNAVREHGWSETYSERDIRAAVRELKGVTAPSVTPPTDETR